MKRFDWMAALGFVLTGFVFGIVVKTLIVEPVDRSRELALKYSQGYWNGVIAGVEGCQAEKSKAPATKESK